MQDAFLVEEVRPDLIRVRHRALAVTLSFAIGGRQLRGRFAARQEPVDRALVDEARDFAQAEAERWGLVDGAAAGACADGLRPEELSAANDD